MPAFRNEKTEDERRTGRERAREPNWQPTPLALSSIDFPLCQKTNNYLLGKPNPRFSLSCSKNRRLVDNIPLPSMPNQWVGYHGPGRDDSKVQTDEKSTYGSASRQECRRGRPLGIEDWFCTEKCRVVITVLHERYVEPPIHRADKVTKSCRDNHTPNTCGVQGHFVPSRVAIPLLPPQE